MSGLKVTVLTTASVISSWARAQLERSLEPSIADDFLRATIARFTLLNENHIFMKEGAVEAGSETQAPVSIGRLESRRVSSRTL
jgi:hypothetical protein